MRYKLRVVYRKSHGIKVADVWYPDENWKQKLVCDVASIYGSEMPINDRSFKMQHTLLTDLNQNDEELSKSIVSTSLRNEIRRSDKDGTIFKQFNSEHFLRDDSILKQFCQCYEEMYKEKDINNKLSMELLKSYINSQAFHLTIAYLYGRPVVYHSYVDCINSVRLWHSCSNYRSQKDIANEIGRANKQLHWEDWLYFRKLEYEVYDWGGVFSFDSKNGIDQFKKSFGGVPHSYYNGKVGISILGKCALKIF